MNILITLPKELIRKIISGEKKFEMRKSMPRLMKLGEDGFFVVEKGTDEIRCWCRVDKINETYIDHYSIDWYISKLCVPAEYIEKYVNGKKVYLWQIGKVVKLQDLCRNSLFVDKNPQQFAYCQLSYGESY